MKKIIPYLLIGSFLLCYPSIAIAKLTTGDFIDTKGHWAEQEIKACTGLDLMSGIGVNQAGEKLFAPDSILNRAQLAVVLQRTFQLDYGEKRFIKQPLASDYYSDVDDKDWYSNPLVMCAINQVFDSQSNFAPDDSVSRIELARAIHRSFKAKDINIPMILSMPIFQDIQQLDQEDTNAMVFVNNTGIMTGDGVSFRPFEQVKRAELARVLNRCTELMSIDENNNTQQVTLRPDQSFTLSLASNPSTGYSWSLSDDWDKKILSASGEGYLSQSKSPLVGQGGHQLFKFKALKNGKTELNLIYSRPWESVQPVKKFKLNLLVTDQYLNSPVKMETKDILKSTDLIDIDLNIPQISGMQNQAAQAAINKALAATAAKLQEPLSSEAANLQKESLQNDFPFRKYQLLSRCSPYYSDENRLSFYIDYYTYTGGAHGSTDRQAHNYDLITGQELTLQDLFSEGFDYKSVINTEIKRQIGIQPDIFFSDEMGFQGISDTQNYYLQKNCLIIYFNQYEIAPYAAGIPEFSIDMNLLSEGMQPTSNTSDNKMK